jgi:signal transduction histidine kinase
MAILFSGSRDNAIKGSSLTLETVMNLSQVALFVERSEITFFSIVPLHPMNYLHPKNWSRFSRRYSGDKEELRKYKRVILLSQFTLFGFVAGLLHAAEDLLDGLRFMPAMDGIMAISIFGCYLLNENGKHRLARIVLLTFLNLFFFVYSSLAHRDLGIYLYYFSWVGLAAVVFEDDENPWRFFFIGLSIFFIVLLFATNFSLFGPSAFEAVDIERSFVINFVSSIIVIVFFIVFMVYTNEQSEKKLIELAEEVRLKNQELEKANRELDRFFYSASHDLRVPLMDIKGAIHSAMTDFDEERVLAYFEILKQRADKLDHFLQDIIDYSRNAQTEVLPESLSVRQLLSAVIENFTFVKGADRITFRVDAENLEVEADRVRLTIVLNNLISNAIKYHRLDQSDPWIRLSCRYNDGKLCFSIEDNGQGIDEDLLPKIFDMFFRGTNQSKGSGLGLYIVRETLQKMGGDISVESIAGSGSKFRLEIPANTLHPRLVTEKTDAPVPVRV